jgi:hypothetical protein
MLSLDIFSIPRLKEENNFNNIGFVGLQQHFDYTSFDMDTTQTSISTPHGNPNILFQLPDDVNYAKGATRLLSSSSSSSLSSSSNPKKTIVVLKPTKKQTGSSELASCSRQNSRSSVGSSRTSSFDSPHIEGESEQERVNRKKKNREAAKQYRERKKAAAAVLKKKVLSLQQENKELQDQLSMYSIVETSAERTGYTGRAGEGKEEAAAAAAAAAATTATAATATAAAVDSTVLESVNIPDVFLNVLSNEEQYQRMLSVLSIPATAITTCTEMQHADLLGLRHHMNHHTNGAEKLMMPIKEYQVLLYLWLDLAMDSSADLPIQEKQVLYKQTLLERAHTLYKALETFHELRSAEFALSEEEQGMLSMVNGLLTADQWEQALQISLEDQAFHEIMQIQKNSKKQTGMETQPRRRGKRKREQIDR